VIEVPDHVYVYMLHHTRISIGSDDVTVLRLQLFFFNTLRLRLTHVKNILPDNSVYPSQDTHTRLLRSLNSVYSRDTAVIKHRTSDNEVCIHPMHRSTPRRVSITILRHSNPFSHLLLILAKSLQHFCTWTRVAPVPNSARRLLDVSENGGRAGTYFQLGTSWRYVGTFKPRPF